MLEVPIYELRMDGPREQWQCDLAILEQELPEIEAEFERQRPDLMRALKVMPRGWGRMGTGQR